jgi:signal transduction histidine kinase
MSIMEPTANQKHLHLTLRSRVEAAFLNGDPERLQEAFCNILSNAIKFTPEGGSIYISVAIDHGLELRVADTGEGIDPHFLPHVFDRFAQADLATRRQGGLGLGLAIVKDVIEAHRGRVEAVSEGKGQLL